MATGETVGHATRLRSRPASTAGTVTQRALEILRLNWAVAAVLAAFVISTFIVPTLSNVPVSDDWVYTRSVQILLHQHKVEILGLSVATLVFQIFWGSLFGLIFGATFVATRLATLTLVFLAALALYGLCREVGISRGRSALGVAVYLFNPVSYAMAFSFMTDPNFLALLIISMYFYVRGLRPDALRPGSIITGSVFAGLGFLVRQQGALIPLAAVLYLLLSQRMRLNRAGLYLFLQVVAPAAVITIAYYYWILFIHGFPTYQQHFMNAADQTSLKQTAVLVERLTFIETMYIGFFILPIAAGAVFGLWRLLRHTPLFSWLLFAVAAAALALALRHYGHEGLRMPYVPHFFGPSGTGPGDLYGGRPYLIPGMAAFNWLTAICAIAAFVTIFALCRQVLAAATPQRSSIGLLLVIGIWQVVGIVPPSFSFKNWKFRGLPAPSLDRYLLPLLPIAIVLLLWALRDVRIILPAAWIMLALVAAFSIAATRDSLVFLNSIWSMAQEANTMGIPNTQLDAGAAWDGYYLYEYSIDNHIPVQSPGGAWWLYVFAPATNSDYTVTGQTYKGHPIVIKREYSQWLQRKPVYLYLLRKSSVPPPPSLNQVTRGK